ncbi:hypothetical protein KCP69_18855 [Salmonella enterica subsp. enterica]|nr:hypothetical protein KCP69_18855 [Salmonella enterica subsp. enterica]
MPFTILFLLQKRSPPYAGDCLSHLCYPTRHFRFHDYWLELLSGSRHCL